MRTRKGGGSANNEIPSVGPLREIEETRNFNRSLFWVRTLAIKKCREEQLAGLSLTRLSALNPFLAALEKERCRKKIEQQTQAEYLKILREYPNNDVVN
jgi:hypothetical protein